MTEAELIALCEKIAGTVCEVYGAYCDRVPKLIVLTAMMGALAACATEADVERARVIDAINSAFDDIQEAA